MRSLKLATIALLALVLAIFTLQNFSVVEVRFLLWKVEMSRSLLLLGVLASGVLLGWLLATLRRR